jgi:hypothetical protein
MKILEKVGIKSLLLGGLSLVVVATAIMASSWILSLGKYDTYPPLSWVISTALAVGAFGGAMYLLGLGGPASLLSMVFGGLSALLVAGTIVGVSYILGAGSYGTYPSLEWSTSVGLSMLAFGTSTLALGVFILGTLGLGMIALAAGSAGTLMIAETIVASADIFRKGNFTGGPKKEWSEGVALAIGAFSPVYGMLMANKIFSIFGGGVGPDEFAKAIRTISTGIVDAANYFNGPLAKAAFKGGPKKDWAEGVGQAIGAFSPVYAVLAANSGWFKSGVSVKDMKSAIMTISEGIVDAATFFGNHKGVFDISKVPSKKWGENVGGAISAFAPIFKQMSEDSGFFTSGASVLALANAAIVTISSSITKASNILSLGNYSKVIPQNWAKGTILTIMQFSKLAKSIKKDMYGGGLTGLISGLIGKDPMTVISEGISKIAISYDKLANSLNKFSGSINSIDVEKLSNFKSLTGNIALLSLMDAELFGDMMDKLEEKAGVFTSLVRDFEKQKSESTSVGKNGILTGKDKKSEVEIISSKMDVIISTLSDIQSVVGSNGTLKSYIDSIDNSEASIGGNKVDYR